MLDTAVAPFPPVVKVNFDVSVINKKTVLSLTEFFVTFSCKTNVTLPYNSTEVY